MFQYLLKGPAFWNMHGWNLKTALSATILDGAALMAFGLLTFLWVEVRIVPSVVWTGLAAALMMGAAAVGKAHLAAERRTLIFAGIFILTYMLGCGFSFLFIADPHPGRADLLIQQYTLLILAAVFFVFGAAAGGKQLFVGFVLAYLSIAIYSLVESGSFNQEELVKRYESDGVVIGYQQLGDSLVICALMIMTRLRHKAAIYVLGLVTILLLAVIPSRSALIFGSIAMVLWALLVSSMRVRIFIIVLSLIFAMTARLVIMSNLAEKLEGTRHAEMLTPEEDASNEERLKIMGEGFRHIRENAIFGHFGFQLTSFNDAGMYIHNLLDIWVQGGLLPFAMFVLLWVYMFRQWYLMYQRNREIALSTLPMLVFPAMSWLVSRHSAYGPMYFCLGYFSASLLRCYNAPPDERPISY